MTLSREVDHIVEVVLRKQLISQGPIANVALDESATLAIYILSDGAQIARIGQQIQYNNLNIGVLLQHVFDEVGSNKASRTGYQVSFHPLLV